MIIFAGDFVLTRADGQWHEVTDAGAMLLLLDNGFLTYATPQSIEKALSAAEHAALTAA